MKIIFMGTPEFAAAFLESLAKPDPTSASAHQVCLVVTQPDRPKGRGQKLTASPVKEKALALGIPVAQPTSLKDAEFHELIRDQEADLLVVVAYRILPATLFSLTRFGAVNVHGSLLPKFRGAAPIQWSIATGETETGVTIFQLDALIDHGQILAQEKIPIGPNDNATDIFERLRELGLRLLPKVLADLESGNALALEQDHAGASPAPKLKKEDGHLDWKLSAQVLHNRIRAFNPYPICYGIQKGTGKILRIHASRLSDSSLKTTASQLLDFEGADKAQPGEVVIGPDRFPWVATANGWLQLLEVQWEGKPRVDGRDFVNGLQPADRENLRFI
jgi:methionyl-tRNA formyltransferase